MMNGMKRILTWSGIATAAVLLPALVGCSNRAELGPVADASTVKSIRDVLVTSKGAGGERAAGATGTGGPTKKGNFVFDGNPPQMPPYGVTKKHKICTTNGTAPPQETLVVAPGSK